MLIIEDDDAIRDSVREALALHGYDAASAPDGRAGLDLALAAGAAFDLVLLDRMLPGLDGLSVLEALRAARPALPVICMTALGEPEDRVRGLRAGADDYVVKPFSVAELVARVEAVLRRSPARAGAAPALDLGAGVRFDPTRRVLERDGHNPTTLPELEASLLGYLAQHAPRPVSRDELLQAVWRLDPRGTRTRSVDMAVARLRDAMRQAGVDADAVVRTVRGAGYAYEGRSP